MGQRIKLWVSFRAGRLSFSVALLANGVKVVVPCFINLITVGRPLSPRMSINLICYKKEDTLSMSVFICLNTTLNGPFTAI